MKIAVFSVSLAYFLFLTAPDSTWINTDADGNNYTTAAKYLVLTHPTGAPLFNLVNWLLIRLPLPGTDFWQLAIWSAIASAGTSTLLYSLRKSIVPPLIFMGSGLVVSQSTIVETYALITFIMVLAYYLHTKEQHTWKYVALGLGLAVHHLAILAMVPILASDYTNKRSLQKSLLMFIALPFYLYIPLVNKPPYEWIYGESLGDYLNYFGAQGWIAGGLAVIPPNDLFTRLRDISILTIAGFASAIPFIALGLYARFKRREFLLPALAIIPGLYYFGMLPHVAYIYYMPAFAFGALLVEIPNNYGKTIVAVTSVFLVVVNIQLYDIGRTLDKDLSATRFYNQLKTLPPDAVVFVDVQGWEGAAIWMYNRDNKTAITGLFSTVMSRAEKEKVVELAQKGAEDNKLFRSILTDPTTYKSDIIKWQPTNEEAESVFKVRSLIEK